MTTDIQLVSETDFGIRLRLLRNSRGMSQAVLATKLGIKKPQISRWENQAMPPRPDTIVKLANALGASPEDLWRSEPTASEGAADIGKRIRILRTQQQLSLHELARLVGVSHVTVSQWENSIREPRLGKLVQLAAVFEVTTDFLLSA